MEGRLKTLGAEALLRPSALKSEVVDLGIPELEGGIRVRELTGRERERVIEEFYDQNGKDLLPKQGALGRMNPTIVAWCAIDDDGTRCFTDDQVDRLMEVSAALLDKLAEKVLELSGLVEPVESAAGN